MHHTKIWYTDYVDRSLNTETDLHRQRSESNDAKQIRSESMRNHGLCRHSPRISAGVNRRFCATTLLERRGSIVKIFPTIVSQFTISPDSAEAVCDSTPTGGVAGCFKKNSINKALGEMETK